jgi:hypothetical protein
MEMNESCPIEQNCTIKEAYETIVAKAHKISRNGLDESHLDFLDLIKDNTYDMDLGPWNTKFLPGGELYQILTIDIMKLTEYHILGNGNKVCDLVNHILIGTVKPPLISERANLKWLYYIGACIGLLQGSKVVCGNRSIHHLLKKLWVWVPSNYVQSDILELPTELVQF